MLHVLSKKKVPAWIRVGQRLPGLKKLAVEFFCGIFQRNLIHIGSFLLPLFLSFGFPFSHLQLQMKIIPIPVLEDNYSYICIDDKTKEAAVIDPVEPIKILNVLSQTGAKLSR
jgi:hypothetical protein